ncbi:thioredoxin-like protein [Amylocarpus encephaloides]|uniref:Thioredoxin-like protein n=1 Tax=Amylocarpus encephaloides TaxID=45428 RepID=A0A9P7YUL8_9HELO|nr:thioredoxin-like protein [Amylocarpus encephaloides]
MFRFHKTLDVITLFHKASLPASSRVHTILKTASATASETATEDQASDHSEQSNPKRKEFQLDVTEEPPTEDQLKSILEYVGAAKISSIVKGAKTEADAMKKLKDSGDNFQRPVTVDWENGRAVAGDTESEILKLVQALPKN